MLIRVPVIQLRKRLQFLFDNTWRSSYFLYNRCLCQWWFLRDVQAIAESLGERGLLIPCWSRICGEDARMSSSASRVGRSRGRADGSALRRRRNT